MVPANLGTAGLVGSLRQFVLDLFFSLVGCCQTNDMDKDMGWRKERTIHGHGPISFVGGIAMAGLVCFFFPSFCLSRKWGFRYMGCRFSGTKEFQILIQELSLALVWLARLACRFEEPEWERLLIFEMRSISH